MIAALCNDSNVTPEESVSFLILVFLILMSYPRIAMGILSI